MSSRELEWFDLETRMRELLHHQLIPVLTKSKEDRDQINTTKSHCAKLESRIKQLETMVFGDRDQETVMQEIFAKFAESEGNRKKDAIKFEQNLSFVHEKLKTVMFSLSEAMDTVASLSNRMLKNEEEVVKIEKIVEHNKELTIREMDNIGRNFRDLNSTYTSVALRAEEKAIVACDKARGIGLEIGMYKKELESIWKSYNEVIYLARDAKANKVDIEDFEDFKEKLNDKFKKVSDDLTHVHGEFYDRDIFIDKFFPMKVVTIVSDYFYHSLGVEQLGKVADYESYLLSEMNTEILNNISYTRETQVQKILSEVKHVEDRKSKLVRTSPRRTTRLTKTMKFDLEVPSSDNLPDIPPIEVPIPITKPVDALNTFPINEAFEDGLIEKLLIKLEYELARIRSELTTKVDQFTQNMKSSVDDNSLLTKQLMCELSELISERNKEKADLEKDLKSITVKLSETKQTMAQQDDLLGKHGKMITILVESFQLQQVLDAQDEEDRHSMAHYLDKGLQNELIMSQNTPETYNSTLPSANFLVKKNCLSCGQATSMLAGMRTSVVYHPSPLVYRDKKFQRPELMKIKGKLIQSMWEFSKLPVTEEEISPIFAKILKGIKSSTGELSGRVGSESKELPLLNFSTSRNRSQRRSRFIARSAVHSVDNYQL